MKFYVTGRVLPERTDVSITSIRNEIAAVGAIIFVCKSSQINMTFDTQLDKVSAFIFCKHYATIVVSSSGFVKGCHYSVELISIMDENLEATVFGVQVPELEEKAINPLFTIVVNLSFRDLFFRFAIMDYTKSITSEIELPFLCYRAIETIKSRFFNDLKVINPKATEKDGWEQMHDSLNTNKEEIMEVKKYADPIRHGNYYTLTSTNSQQRFEILSITKNIIQKYKQFLEDKFQMTVL